jgi:DNA-binding NarL/FixJ family response regulator
MSTYRKEEEEMRHARVLILVTAGLTGLTGTGLTDAVPADAITAAQSQLVTQGLNNQQVADRMYVSVHTVAFHLRQIFRKRNIGSRIELTRIATQQASQR